MTNVVNVVGSTLARVVGSGVYMNAGREMAVAATKSFMNSCVCLVEIQVITVIILSKTSGWNGLLPQRLYTIPVTNTATKIFCSVST